MELPRLFVNDGKEKEKTRLLFSISELLSKKEVSHLIFLSKGVLLPKEVAEKLKTFPELVKELETYKKIDKEMKDWQILYDMLELIKRKDIIKKLTTFRKKSEVKQSGIGIPILSDIEGLVPITEDTVALKQIIQKGDYYSDLWKGIFDKDKKVLIEVYKISTTSDMQRSFARQGDIQSRLQHKNIVEVLKVFRNKEPPWIVLEWMDRGDLLSFVRSQNPTNLDLIGFATQIAEGMDHMEKQKYVHCDLKASNVFLTENKTIKIGGFSLARKLGDDRFLELEEDVVLSVPWADPQLIFYQQCTKRSDVWSFGIVVMELMTRGIPPYGGMGKTELVRRLRQGFCHPQPEECSRKLYGLVKRCWNIPEDKRPSFEELVTHLKNYTETDEPPGRGVVMRREASTTTYDRRIRSTLFVLDNNTGLDVPRSSDANKRNSYLMYIERSLARDPSKLQTDNRSSLFPDCPVGWTQGLQLPRSSVTLKEMIGSGEYGEVWKAELSDKSEVAVKTFLPTRVKPEQFLEEAEMMLKFSHPHLVRLLGVCSEELPIYIITELMPFGCLLHYLQKDGGYTLQIYDLLDYASQVADAMTYIEAMNCIHRDIAARNVLVFDRNTVKLGDFGLSRTVIASYYLGSRDYRFPARWTAPESKKSLQFSIKSDVWAFGVLLVELMTCGEKPYPELNELEVLDFISKGHKHPQPFGCPDDVYEVMITCWREKAENRPSFKELFNTVKALRDVYKKAQTGYTQL